MKLYFERNLAHYMIQIYLPSTLIVILSWVSFWLDKTSSPARVSLGITTVLTMVHSFLFYSSFNFQWIFCFLFVKLTLIWSTNASLPKISYIKSIDVYLVFCFFLTFAAVIEFGMVSFMSRFKKRKTLKNFSLEKKKTISTDYTEINLEAVLEEKQKSFQSKIKASSIDNISRFMFPIIFLIFHIIYWTFYLTVTMNVKTLDDEI